MEIVAYESSYQTFCADDFIFIKNKDNFVWCVDSNVTDRLGSYFMLVMNIKLNNTFRTKVDDTLAWIFASKIKDNLFVWIIFSIFPQIVVIFNRIPNNTYSSEVFCMDLIRHWHKPNINRPIDRCTPRHGLTSIKCLWGLRTKDIRYEFMHKRNSRRPTNHLNG